MAISRKVIRPDYLSVDASALNDSSWTLVGSLTYPVRQIKFKNRTNGAVELSYTKENGCVTLWPGEHNVDDLTSNSPSNGDVFDEPKGRSYYARWIPDAPASPSGSLVIEMICPDTGV